MGTWRHPNIVGLRAFYASAEELLLVFDYIPNGSLHSLLHENRGLARVPLDWQTRLKLAQDAAHGLAYLHGVSGGKLSHRHLTSSNILVDGSGAARVSDFALLQLLSPGDYSSLQKQDVHGFGVVLLELLTGRQPSGEDGGGGAQADLPRWARAAAREEWASEVLDVELVRAGVPRTRWWRSCRWRCSASRRSPGSGPGWRWWPRWSRTSGTGGASGAASTRRPRRKRGARTSRPPACPRTPLGPPLHQALDAALDRLVLTAILTRRRLKKEENIVKSCVTFCPLANELCQLDMW
ncbi:hypothetical protein PVAP13_5NG439340 [Panicum virgatum]|uniref:Protein kinase domain-containing protein n=1 Tax=Panicum virgatum TaxID=38727 RepID=A0A8T0RX62_PANVG|nr:hypothetical protein PVAP13_5NG439340 [Panicum virgatum]